jgi:hypothetical protein
MHEDGFELSPWDLTTFQETASLVIEHLERLSRLRTPPQTPGAATVDVTAVNEKWLRAREERRASEDVSGSRTSHIQDEICDPPKNQEKVSELPKPEKQQKHTKKTEINFTKLSSDLGIPGLFVGIIGVCEIAYTVKQEISSGRITWTEALSRLFG